MGLHFLNDLERWYQYIFTSHLCSPFASFPQAPPAQYQVKIYYETSIADFRCSTSTPTVSCRMFQPSCWCFLIRNPVGAPDLTVISHSHSEHHSMFITSNDYVIWSMFIQSDCLLLSGGPGACFVFSWMVWFTCWSLSTWSPFDHMSHLFLDQVEVNLKKGRSFTGPPQPPMQRSKTFQCC